MVAHLGTTSRSDAAEVDHGARVFARQVQKLADLPITAWPNCNRPNLTVEALALDSRLLPLGADNRAVPLKVFSTLAGDSALKNLAWVGPILAFLLSGCTPSLYGYARIRVSDQHISEEVREAIVNDGLTREQVIAQLGEPSGINDEVHSIGYSRCISSTGWGVFGPGSVNSCQRVVFWFDEKGRAYAENSGVAHCEENESCFGRSFSQWLAAPPRSRGRK